jgi:hypothetical protein
VISKGEKKEGAAYKALGSASYLINMDDATMTFSGEVRRFSKEEAANVHVLMDLIAKYAVDSTVWWDDGQGTPVNGDGKTKEPDKPRKPQRDRDRDDDSNVAILHVSTTADAPLRVVCPSSLEVQIQQLETRLAALKKLEKKLGGGQVRLATYTH